MEATEEVDRRLDSRFWEELGPFGLGSAGLEDQRDLHPPVDE